MSDDDELPPEYHLFMNEWRGSAQIVFLIIITALFLIAFFSWL